MTPKGPKYWRLKYRFLGKEKVLALGVYPETTLADARDAREAAKKLIKQNIDPVAHKQENKAAAKVKSKNTFEAVAREWHENNISKWTPRHAAYIITRLEADLFPELGQKPVAGITSLQLLTALRKIEARGAHEIAKRCRQMAGQILRYAIVTGRAERDVAADLKEALKPQRTQHFRAMDAKVLPAFLQAFNRNDARLYACNGGNLSRKQDFFNIVLLIKNNANVHVVITVNFVEKLFCFIFIFRLKYNIGWPHNLLNLFFVHTHRNVHRIFKIALILLR